MTRGGLHKSLKGISVGRATNFLALLSSPFHSHCASSPPSLFPLLLPLPPRHSFLLLLSLCFCFGFCFRQAIIEIWLKLPKETFVELPRVSLSSAAVHKFLGGCTWVAAVENVSRTERFVQILQQRGRSREGGGERRRKRVRGSKKNRETKLELKNKPYFILIAILVHFKSNLLENT